MEVFVSGSLFSFTSVSFPAGSCIRDVVDSFLNKKGVPSLDFYVTSNGRRLALEDPVQHAAVYRLEPRLCGGKGGFGSMLRALGAQIEKTTNREACRDLSGRRLRDVNHEKEMAEWLKKQSERDAEKEQRRLERLQRKLAEPKHQFTDTEYQQQCHDLSERLEDSVLKGMQASSSGLVQVEEGRAAKRPNPDKTQRATKKKKCFWTGVGDLDELASSEEEEGDDEDEEESPSSCGAPDKPEPAHTTSSSSPEPHQAEQTRCPEERPEHPEASRSSVESTTTQQLDGPVTPVDLEAVGSIQELEELGLEVLKVELMSRGLKCGGTLPERAARLFSVKGLKPEQIDPVLLAKSSKGKKK